jgi:response regulator of citrate/malate metabolism
MLSRIDSAVRSIDRELVEANAALAKAGEAHGRAVKRLSATKAQVREAQAEVNRLLEARALLKGESSPVRGRGRPKGDIDRDAYEHVIRIVQAAGRITVAEVYQAAARVSGTHERRRIARPTVKKYLALAEEEGRVRRTGALGRYGSPVVEYVAPVVNISTRRSA